MDAKSSISVDNKLFENLSHQYHQKLCCILKPLASYISHCTQHTHTHSTQHTLSTREQTSTRRQTSQAERSYFMLNPQILKSLNIRTEDLKKHRYKTEACLNPPTVQSCSAAFTSFEFLFDLLNTMCHDQENNDTTQAAWRKQQWSPSKEKTRVVSVVAAVPVNLLELPWGMFWML